MTYCLEHIEEAVDYIMEHRKSDVLFFDAPMGAGKTTLIAALCKKLGVDQGISSPTFNIVNEYQGKDFKILHFDLYRIQSIDELHDIGVEDYIDQKGLKLIEWPEVITSFISDYQVVDIKPISEEKRDIRVSDVFHR